MLQSLQSHLLDGNYRKRSPDPLKGTQAECQDITANQHPTTVPIVPYRMATKYQHVAASECEWHAQLATDTAVSQKWLKYCSLFRMPAAKRILAVRTLLPSVHLVDIDITHVIFYQAPVFAYYKWSKVGGGNDLRMRLRIFSLWIINTHTILGFCTEAQNCMCIN